MSNKAKVVSIKKYEELERKYNVLKYEHEYFRNKIEALKAKITLMEFEKYEEEYHKLPY